MLHFLFPENKYLKDIWQACSSASSVPEKSPVSVASALYMGLGANPLCNGIQQKNQKQAPFHFHK